MLSQAVTQVRSRGDLRPAESIRKSGLWLFCLPVAVASGSLATAIVRLVNSRAENPSPAPALPQQELSLPF